MGFPEVAARAALAAAGGDVGAAAEALAEPNAEPAAGARETASPDSPEEVDARSGTPLMQLLAMGFQRAAAVDALARANGDLAAAAEGLAEAAAGDEEEPGPPPALASSSSRRAAPERRRDADGHVEGGPLGKLSHRAKTAVVAALAGRDGSQSGAVERSIRRGRVAFRRNVWDGDADEERLSELSPAYKQLKGYQKAGVRWLLGLAKAGFGGILADEMGLGKTATTLTFLDLFQKLGQGGRGGDGGTVSPTLIVVPPTLLATWEIEARRWCPHFRLFRYHSSSAQEREGLIEQYLAAHRGHCDLVLTTPSLLHNKDDRARFFRRLSFDYLICDEAHSLRNATAARFRDVQKAVRARRRLLLTGTPVQNSLRELGNLLTLLLAVPQEDNSASGGSHRLERGVQKALDQLEDVVERGVLRTLQVRAAPFILRRLKRDVMKELPPKVGDTVRCKLAPVQQELYDRELAVAREASKLQRGRGPRQDFVKNLFFRLRRICNHPLMGQSRFDDSDYVRLVSALRRVRPDFQRVTAQKALDEVRTWSDFDIITAVREYDLASHLGKDRFDVSKDDLLEGSAKIQELIRLLTSQRKAGSKTLVFSQFTQYLNVVSEALDVAGFAHMRLDGAVSVADRPELVRRFQEEGSGSDIFLLSTKAGGTGLNLTAADKVVLMDLCFNPQDNRQAEDRAHRLGQTRPVAVHYLVSAGTIEETVLQANLQKMVLDYKFGGQRSLLGRDGCQPSPAAEQEEDEDEEEEDAEAGEAKGAKVAKCLERQVLAELEGVCAAPVP